MTELAVATVRVPARVGLLGNPSDGYGGRVIAATIDDLGATVQARPATLWEVHSADGYTTAADSIDVLRRGLAAPSLDAGLSEGAELLAASLVRIAQHPDWPEDAPPQRLSFTTTIPRQCGLSGSSAIIVGALQVLAETAPFAIGPDEIARLALEVETQVLGWAAGPQDRIIQALGGVLDMDFGRGWDPAAWRRVAPNRLPPLVLAWFPGPGEPSGLKHGDLRQRFDAGDAQVIDTISAFADLAEHGRRALDADTAHLLWPDLLDQAWTLRTRLWDPAPPDRRLIDLAQRHGVGASLAGSGGAIVGVPRDVTRIEPFIAAVQAIGGVAIRPTVGPAVDATTAVTPRTGAIFQTLTSAPFQTLSSAPTGGTPAWASVDRVVEAESPAPPTVQTVPAMQTVPAVLRGRIGAVILAAGFGTRLAPITNHTPKPLIEVGGRPVATHLVDLLHEADPDMAIVVVTNGRHVDAWNTWQLGLHRPVHVISNGVMTVETRLGAVADLAFALAALPPTEQVVVLAGDNLIIEPLAPHITAAEATAAPVVLCRDLGAAVPPGRFGEITTDALGRVTSFREKPPDPRSPLAATCTYVLPGPELEPLLDTYLQDGDADSPGRFIGWLAERSTVFARTLTGDYYDIGNHETLAAARAAFGS